jgi:hypothetical protein
VDTPKVFFPGRRTLPKAAAFWILAVLFLMLFFASAAASPLYPVYQVQFGFSAATLTAVFAVYVLVLLATLLFFGTVSDYLGRLPVIVMALVFSVAGCAVFLAAHGVGALYAARSLQGIATGLASGAAGAALIELQPAGSQRASLVTSAFSTLGGDRHLHRGLPRVQHSGADRWRGDHEVRTAPDRPGLLRFARRPGRGGGRDPAVRPLRQARPASPSLACGHATRPVHRSAMPAGH